MIYFDNAATTGTKPRSVVSAVNNALLNLSANPGRSGHTLSVNSAMAVFGCRKILKNFFNASNENCVCFTINCTHAINTVLHGVLEPNDHVIISSLEHNAVLRPVHALHSERRIEYDIADIDLLSDETTLRNIEEKIKPNTKMVFVTAASNVIGRALPLKQIGLLCRDRGIYFAVDAAQVAGVLPIDVQKMNIDFLCIAPHKGFYAPMGTGVLIAEAPIGRVLISGGTGVNSVELTQPEELPERIESGTLNLPGIVGVKAGVNFVERRGLKNIFEHEARLCGYIYSKLKRMGCELYTPEFVKEYYAPVISFNIRGVDSGRVGEHLNRMNIAVRSGLHCAPLAHKQISTLERGTVRVSPSVFNSFDDADRLIFAVKRLI